MLVYNVKAKHNCKIPNKKAQFKSFNFQAVLPNRFKKYFYKIKKICFSVETHFIIFSIFSRKNKHKLKNFTVKGIFKV